MWPISEQRVRTQCTVRRLCTVHTCDVWSMPRIIVTWLFAAANFFLAFLTTFNEIIISFDYLLLKFVSFVVAAGAIVCICESWLWFMWELFGLSMRILFDRISNEWIKRCLSDVTYVRCLSPVFCDFVVLRLKIYCTAFKCTCDFFFDQKNVWIVQAVVMWDTETHSYSAWYSILVRF